jgi:hypothetical protein
VDYTVKYSSFDMNNVGKRMALEYWRVKSLKSEETNHRFRYVIRGNKYISTRFRTYNYGR